MVPHHLVASLATAADTAINNVLQVGASGQSKPTGEVGFVAAVVIGGVHDIANAWSPLLHPHGLSVKMSGVFCHQTPRATFTDNHGTIVSCELADLLVVVEDNTGGRPGRRWAVLIQAKMAAPGGGQTLTQPGDLRQLDLMSRWPSFTLPKNFAPGARNFATCRYQGKPLDCGRYGLVEGQPSPDWHQQAPAPVMPAGGDRLGSFLAHMVETGQVGYGREATGLGDDWSRTVDELMTQTYSQFFSYAAGFSGRRQRGHSAFAMAISGPYDPSIVYFNSDGPPPSGGRPDELGDDERPNGINLLRIAIGSNDYSE
ncbi:MAG: hypothetical protein AB3N21_18310 [Ruegeria sp.]|uniref:hypothetical protein n=1 Tax=Ruegeria sp. TaxID=1879320 RepID=UPI00349ED0ED